ncbi:MAG: hypothetical protein IJB37_07040 [Peptococcaceae bacterium]|nr:hypothetical protein [Peptococcaceae bacterium]MBQ3510356.1 hypothetical protein [Peptococcaceae bacterium]
MQVDGRGLGEEQCKESKKAMSKYGVTLVCDEEDEKPTVDGVMTAGENCENVKVIASKHGLTVVCDEDA